MKLKRLNKKAQEEILGFALIIIIVAVILLVFLGISLNKSKEQSIESYEVQNFIQSFLQYTTSCTDKFETDYMNLQEVIIECNNYGECLDGSDVCEVLDTTLREITEESWSVGEETYVRGYDLNITSEGEILTSFKKGNTTINYKGNSQKLPSRGDLISIEFTAYY